MDPDPDCEITLVPPAAAIVAPPSSVNRPPPVLDMIEVPVAAVMVTAPAVLFATKL
jgi:hypothetical protein